MRMFRFSPAPAIVLFAATLGILPTQIRAADGEQKFAELGTCKLTSARQIENCRVGYRTWGTLNAQGSNAILFPTWFSGNSSNLAAFVGADKMIDPAKFFLIAVDALGDGVSSSPSNSETQHATRFPLIT